MAAIGTLPVVLGTGIHSARPAASAVGKGGLYACSTHALIYQTDGSSWTTWATLGSGTSLLQDVARRTAGDLTTTSTSMTDVTGMAITGTTGARRCLVSFSAAVYHNSSQGTINATLTIDGTDVGGSIGLTRETTVSGGNDVHNLAFTYLTDALTAGSHTFKVRWSTNAGTANMFAASSTFPAQMSVVEIA